MRSKFWPDRQLTPRTMGTMFLLGLLYVGFAAALAALLRSVVWVVLIAGGLPAVQYWFADRIALLATHARELSPEEEPLHKVIDRLCAVADMPKPRVAVSEMDLPIAFATGRNANHAVVCVTTGVPRRLEPEELEGVLAHELSHVAHRDVTVITIASLLGASFLGMLACLIDQFAFHVQLFSGRDDQNTAAWPALVLAVSITVYAINCLLIRALSRCRELAADRAGAQLTGRPSALASALVKVTGEMGRIPTRDLRTAQRFNASFPPALTAGCRLATLFSTHPSLDRRLAELAKLSAQLGEQTGPDPRARGKGILQTVEVDRPHRGHLTAAVAAVPPPDRCAPGSCAPSRPGAARPATTTR